MDSSRIDFLIAGLPEKVRHLEEIGLFNDAISSIRHILDENKGLPSILRYRLEWEQERIERIKKDYRLNQKQAYESLKGKIPDLKPEEFEKWIQEGFIEQREIEREIRIFSSFLPNLLRDNAEVKRRVERPDETSDLANDALYKHIEGLITKPREPEGRYTQPVRNRVLMALNVDSHAIPEGDIVRVWMPFPLKDPLQPDVKLIYASPDNYILAPDDSPQRTIYFEKRATKNDELRFQVEYEYTILTSYQEVDSENVRSYVHDQAYGRYTSEQLPHVAFTPFLKKLTQEIVADEANPYLKAWRIYNWITQNITYALVPEYSTIECISDYGARNLSGDCGVQALLFITLCRICGVPARWQSGWYLNPIKSSPHDWAQYYVEPYGWLYADPSFGGHAKSIERYRQFYFRNIDHFRLVANTDISSEFTPPKTHFRSDTVDNQRGEVERTDGNIYFDRWNYGIKILSHKAS